MLDYSAVENLFPSLSELLFQHHHTFEDREISWYSLVLGSLFSQTLILSQQGEIVEVSPVVHCGDVSVKEPSSSYCDIQDNIAWIDSEFPQQIQPQDNPTNCRDLLPAYLRQT